MDDLKTEQRSFVSQAACVNDVLGLFWTCYPHKLYNQALTDVRSTGAGIKWLYCSTGRVRPADRPTGIVAAKHDVTIQIPAYHAPPRRTTINHSNPGTPGSYFKQYLAEAPCFPAKSRPPPPPRDSIDWCIICGGCSNLNCIEIDSRNDE